MDMNEPVEWWINTTNKLEVGYDDRTDDGEPLFSVDDDTYPEDATITVTIKDRYGVVVTGAEDIPMTHVAATTGAETKYRAYFAHTLPLAIGRYTAVATAIVDGNQSQAFKAINVRRGG